MSYSSHTRGEAIRQSDMPTEQLAWLAVTLPVQELGNELFGRSHCWYAIASSRVAAFNWLHSLGGDDTTGAKLREVASKALGLGGWDVDQLKARNGG